MAKNERLKEVVEEIKFRFKLKTQKDVCSKLGYTSSTYLSDMISGKTPLSENFLERLRGVFGVDTDYLAGADTLIFIDERAKSSNNQIGENITYQQCANSSTLDKALTEITEMRTLLAESVRNVNDLSQRLMSMLENTNK